MHLLLEVLPPMDRVVYQIRHQAETENAWSKVDQPSDCVGSAKGNKAANLILDNSTS